MGVDVRGEAALFEELDELADDFSDAGDWVVGTAVEYAAANEFGTATRDARPFFRPALSELRGDVAGFIDDNSQTDIDEIDSGDELVATVAFALERRIKEIVTRKGIVDTGTLRASILAVPRGAVGDLPDASEFSGFDSDNPAPATAGRSLVGTTAEFDIGGNS